MTPNSKTVQQRPTAPCDPTHPEKTLCMLYEFNPKQRLRQALLCCQRHDCVEQLYMCVYVAFCNTDSICPHYCILVFLHLNTWKVAWIWALQLCRGAAAVC